MKHFNNVRVNAGELKGIVVCMRRVVPTTPSKMTPGGMTEGECQDAALTLSFR